MLVSSCDGNIVCLCCHHRKIQAFKTLYKLYTLSTVKRTVTISLDNYFKRQTTSENEARIQTAAAPANLANIEETEVHDALQNACKKATT